MQRIFQFSYRFAPAVIGCFFLLTALSLWLASSVEVEVSSDSLIPRDSPARVDYERVRDTFGSDRIAAVYVEDAGLFTPDKLARLRELHLELKKLPYVQRAENLFTTSNIYGTGGWVDTSPLLQTLPTTQQQADARQERALQNPLLERSVISEDGEATLLSLYLKPQAVDQSAYEREAYTAIENILKKYQGDFDQAFQVGAPALQVWMSDYILQDQRLLLPLAAVIMVTLIGMMMGSLQAAIIPVLNAFIAGAMTLGFMSLVGIPISMLNYVIPALILIIGATEDVHILSEYREVKEEGLVGLEAVTGIARKIGLTLVLTGITTTLGFAVTGLNAITMMQEFGLSAAFGMAARFFVSLCFLPAYLRYFGNAIKAAERTPEENIWHQRLTVKCCQLIMSWTRHPVRVLAVFTLIAIPCLFLIPNIRVSNDLISFLREDSPIRQKLNTVAERLSGNKVIYITLEGEPGDYKQVNRLKQVDRLANWLRERGDLDKVIAHTDFLALVNQAMYGNEPGSLEVPDKDHLVAQYLIFFHRSTLKPYVSGDYSQANIVIRCNLNDSQVINELVEDIEAKLERGAFGKHSYTVTGQSVIVAAAVEEIIRGQVMSLSSMIAFLFITISLLFLSWRAGFLTVLSNAFAVVVIFGLMALTGIPLNVGTCMVAAITIGVAVDDTLHLMVRYNQQLKLLKEERPAIAEAVRAEFFPVLTTSLGLAGGFLILGFSSFVPVMQFGFLSAFVMLLAFIADIILTPVLLATTRLITLWDVIGLNLRKALLESSPMFQGMSKWQAKKLILLANLQDCEPGTTIIKEGQLGNRMYVVIDGEFEVSKQVEGSKLVLSTLKLGDVVGEVGLVSRVERTADVTASTEGRLLVLDWDSLVKLQRSSPYLASRLFLNLSRILGGRLRDALGRVSSAAVTHK